MSFPSGQTAGREAFYWIRLKIWGNVQVIIQAAFKVDDDRGALLCGHFLQHPVREDRVNLVKSKFPLFQEVLLYGLLTRTDNPVFPDAAALVYVFFVFLTGGRPHAKAGASPPFHTIPHAKPWPFCHPILRNR